MQRIFPFIINEKIILRSPRISFDNFFENLNFHSKIQNESFKESLYIASPDLFERVTLDGGNKVLTSSLMKYFSRACFRCTPFGLFAGLSIAQWGEQTTITFDGERRQTRLDMACLYKLVENLLRVPAIINSVKFQPNNSIFIIGNKIRYIEYANKENRRHYNLNEVSFPKELKNILKWAAHGIKIEDITNKLTSKDISKESAKTYVDSLIASQLLISDLEPFVTGTDFLANIINVLEIADKKETQLIVDTLKKVCFFLKELDSHKCNTLQDYDNILSLLNSLEIDYTKNKVFQVDLFKTTQRSVVSSEIKKGLQDGLEALTRLASLGENTRLTEFKVRFQERYEQREIPLHEVLDTEKGIGYPELILDDVDSLTQDVILPPEGNFQFNLSKPRKWLFQKLQLALFHNQYNINIATEELLNFSLSWEALPSSFSITFKITNFKNNEFYLENVGGSNAANLLGRFASGDKEINEVILALANEEQQNNPDVIFAEIIHIPDNRMGNVIFHPPFYDYEIPYLAKSSAPDQYQIPISDLYVSINGNQLRLVSKKLKKQIIPRLSNAHNFLLSELPIYKFLCDFQTQNQVNNLTFSWGKLSEESVFLPRVTYCNQIILHLATWNLPRIEWEVLLKKEDDPLLQDVKEFKAKWKLPRHVVLVDYDNELFIDFENNDTVNAWLHTIKGRETITLKEFLFDPETPIKDGNEAKYISQFIAPVIRKGPSPLISSMRVSPASKDVLRTFLPGSEWLYYKYYCGVKVADQFLIKIIKPLTEKLLKDRMIDSWFFARYRDPHSHLRVRFHLTNISHLSKLIIICNTYLNKFVKQGWVWKVQMDTYEREIERYGSNSIDTIEKISFSESKSTINFLQKIANSSYREEIRWLWGIRAIDELLHSFQFSLIEKLELMESLRNAFKSEFNLEKFSNFQLDKKYRKYKPEIESILNSENTTYSPLFHILRHKSKEVASMIDNLLRLEQEKLLSVKLDSLVRSIIHMFINRLIPHSQRLHEMIIYDFMFRHYNSQKARINYSEA